MSVKRVAVSMAIFTAFSFVVCVIFGLIMPAPFQMSSLLELVLPGFSWLTFTSFLIGLFESAAWGVYLGGGFAMVYNRLSNIK